MDAPADVEVGAGGGGKFDDGICEWVHGSRGSELDDPV